MNTIIGPLDMVGPNDRLLITFNWGGVLYDLVVNEAGVRRAVESAGFNVLAVNTNMVLGFRKIEVVLRPKASGLAGDVGREAAAAIGSEFLLVWNVEPEKYELVTGNLIPEVPATTAISLGSLAVLAVVGFVLWRQATS